LFYAYANFSRVVPVLIIPDEANNHINGQTQDMGIYRRQFLLESALELQFELQKQGIDLILLKGNKALPHRLKEICTQYCIEHTVTSYPRGTYECNLLGSLCQHTAVFTCEDDVIIEAETLPFSLETLPETFTVFRKKVEKNLQVRDICGYPAFKPFENKEQFGDTFKAITTDRHPNSAYPFKGGEEQASNRLYYYLWESQSVSTYKETRNQMIGTDFSSKLSAYLALGNISPVQVYHALKDFEKQVIENQSTYWLLFELLWREFFILIAEKYRARIYSLRGIRKEIHTYRNDLQKFDQWCQGKTDNQFINANMKELVQTGYMSNRGRQNVASYLVHHLRIDWRLGASFFEKHLIDYDLSLNWCNWMYVAGVGNDPMNRVFNPDLQQKRYDPEFKYCKLWTAVSISKPSKT